MVSQDMQLRLDICEAGRRLWQRGLVASNDGNISARLGDGTVLCTPTGVSKGFMRPEDLCLLSPGGELLSGPRPSIETPMHLWVYQTRPDIGGVIHAHPPAATAYASAGRTIPGDLLTEMTLGLGEIPLVDHGTPGSMDVPTSLGPVIHTANVFLIANHGALAVGGDVFEAYFRMESVELCAHTTFFAEQLGPRPLDPASVKRLQEIRQAQAPK